MTAVRKPRKNRSKGRSRRGAPSSNTPAKRKPQRRTKRIPLAAAAARIPIDRLSLESQRILMGQRLLCDEDIFVRDMIKVLDFETASHRRKHSRFTAGSLILKFFRSPAERRSTLETFIDEFPRLRQSEAMAFLLAISSKTGDGARAAAKRLGSEDLNRQVAEVTKEKPVAARLVEFSSFRIFVLSLMLTVVGAGWRLDGFVGMCLAAACPALAILVSSPKRRWSIGMIEISTLLALGTIGFGAVAAWISGPVSGYPLPFSVFLGVPLTAWPIAILFAVAWKASRK